MRTTNQNSDQLLTISEAAEFLNLKTSRLRFEVFHKKIPYYKIGRSIRFSEKDLISWVMGQRQEVVIGEANEKN